MKAKTLLPIAMAAVLVLGACGSDEPESSGTVPPTVGDGGDTGLRAPTPIEITSGNAGGARVAGEAAGKAAASDMMIAPAYWIADYVVGEGMPALPTNDVGYVFDRSRTFTQDEVAQIAAVFGVTGEPVRTDDGSWVSWRVGPEDGSAPMLWASDDAQLSWSYNGAWADQPPRVACAVPVDSDGTEVVDDSGCEEPEPPVGVPTAEEAEQRVRELLVALGEDPSGLRFETYADEWLASVNAFQPLDDLVDARSWYFGFGAEGVLQFAGGTIAVPEPVGPYPLIGIDEAIDRLLDQSGFWGGYGVGRDLATDSVAVAESDVATAEAGETAPEPMPVETVEPMPVESIEPMPVESIEPMPVESIEPMPVESIEPMPEPEPVTITLVDVQPDLWWAWDTDGSVWLLPAYRFVDTDGGWHVVPAVTDEFLVQVDPPVAVGEPEPADDPDAVVGSDGSSGGATDPGAPAPIADPAELKALVGLGIEEFTEAAMAIGYTTRVVVQDGEALAVTDDFSETRVNVAVEADVVVEIQSIG